MRHNNEDYDDYDDDKTRDYFDGPDIDEPVPEKKKRLTPDDPSYYDEEESKWEHLRISHRRRFWVYLLTGAFAVCILVGGYIFFFGTYIEDGTQYGYIESMDDRGRVFTTGEGVLLPYKELMDTSRVYREDIRFSAMDKSVSSQLKRWQIEVRPVKVQYKVYNSRMPWRGETKMIITQVDTISPTKILPPEYNPAYFSNRRDLTDTLDIRAREERIDKSDLDY